MIRTADEMTVESRENMRGGKGTVYIRHCFKKDEFGAKVRLCSVLTMPPGTSIGMHPHDAEDEVFIVIKGQGLHDDGKTQVRIGPGCATLTGKGQSHGISNVGTDTLEIVAIIACYQ